jgi:S-DNA-T family DNA segregation ATPase FtsK/SpoIIIE
MKTEKLGWKTKLYRTNRLAEVTRMVKLDLMEAGIVGRGDTSDPEFESKHPRAERGRWTTGRGGVGGRVSFSHKSRSVHGGILGAISTLTGGGAQQRTFRKPSDPIRKFSTAVVPEPEPKHDQQQHSYSKPEAVTGLDHPTTAVQTSKGLEHKFTKGGKFSLAAASLHARPAHTDDHVERLRVAHSRAADALDKEGLGDLSVTKKHRELSEHYGNVKQANQSSDKAFDASSKASKTPEEHDLAAEAHRTAAEHHEKAGMGDLAKHHRGLVKAHEALANVHMASKGIQAPPETAHAMSRSSQHGHSPQGHSGASDAHHFAEKSASQAGHPGLAGAHHEAMQAHGQAAMQKAFGAVTPEHRETGRGMTNLLRENKVGAKLTNVKLAPNTVRYSLKMGGKYTAKDVNRLSDAIQLHLKTDEKPAITTSGGRVHIDVPRKDRQPVHFQHVAHMVPRGTAQHGSAHLIGGLDAAGKMHTLDLANPDTPHVLISGGSGSGKSKHMQASIAGLMHANTPDTLRIEAIDPKNATFNHLHGSPFLHRGSDSLVTDFDKQDPVEPFRKMASEIDRRTRLMGTHDLEKYREKTGRKLPRVVGFIDEYKDMMDRSSPKQAKEIEKLVGRIAQVGRQRGVHLVIGTQTPLATSIPTKIANNLAGRITMKSATSSASRAGMGASGAERLLGKGDLYLGSSGEAIRAQSPLLSDEHVKHVFGGGDVYEHGKGNKGMQTSKKRRAA